MKGTISTSIMLTSLWVIVLKHHRKPPHRRINTATTGTNNWRAKPHRKISLTT